MYKTVYVSLIVFLLLTNLLTVSCSDENETTAPTDLETIKAPSNLKSVQIGVEYINLTWIDNSDNEESFVLESKTDDSDWAILVELAENVTSYKAENLIEGKKYFFRIYAKNQSFVSTTTESINAETKTKLQPFLSKYFVEYSDTLRMFQRGELRGFSINSRYFENGELVLKEYTKLENFNFEETAITRMDPETYFVNSFTEDINGDVVSAQWDNLKVTVNGASGQFEKDLEAGTTERISFIYMVGALPLEENYSKEIPMYNVRMNRVYNLNVVVRGIETISVLAGQFETYFVELDGTSPHLQMWIDIDTRRVVRMELPTDGWVYQLDNK